MSELPEGAPPPIRLFYSYAREDEIFRKELDKHLSALKRTGVIAPWHDRRIVPGVDWAHEIDRHLEDAHLVLLLVSADFLASEYCWGVEMTRALEMHGAGTARVVPVMVRPVDIEGVPFANLQALPRDAKPITEWGNPDTAWADVAKGIRLAAKELRDQGIARPAGISSPEKQVTPSAIPPHASAPPAADRSIDHEPPSGDHAAIGSLYREYWDELGAALARSGSRLRQPTLRAKNYVRFPAGGSGARMYAFASIRERYLGVELALDPDCADIFRALQRQRETIEGELGQELEWIEHPKSYRIIARVRGHDPADRADWGRQHAWFVGTLEQFNRNLVTRIGRGSIFRLKLQETYYEKGLFNVGVDYDHYVRKADGPIRLRLGRQGKEIEGILGRQANANGTARIYGGPPLREWFQANFEPMETVAVDLSSEDVIVLEKE
jgi:hypothetical protein